MMKITKRQAVFATVNFICAKLFIFAPQRIIDIGKNASWITVIINTLITLTAFLLIYYFYKKSGMKDMFSLMPPFLRATVSFFAALYFIITAALSLNTLIKGVIRSFMSESPSLFIVAFFVVAVFYGAKKGIKANIEISMIFAPLLLIIGAVFIYLIPYFDFTNFFPLLSDNNFYLPSMFGFNFFSDFFIFFFMMPYLDDKKEGLKAGIESVVISSILYFIVVTLDIMTIPYEARFISPYYQMTTFMAGSNGVISVIKMFKLVFLLNFILYLSTAASFASHSLKVGFNLKNSERTAEIVTILILLIEQMKYSDMGISKVYSFVYSYSWIVFPLIPLITYVFFRRRNN